MPTLGLTLPARLLASLLPPDVVWHAGRIQDIAGLAEPLPPEEAAAIARAVPKRQREFAAGRHCARRALRGLRDPQRPAGSEPIPAGPDRAPCWPAGVVGSITHNDEFCAAAVAHAATFAGLGIDIDAVERFDADLESAICTPGEIRRWLTGHDNLQRQRRLAAIFSFKESFYKAQYATSRAWLGFEDVEVTRLDGWGEALTTLELQVLRAPQARPANSALPDEPKHAHDWLLARCWTGHCALDAEHVASSMIIRSESIRGAAA